MADGIFVDDEWELPDFKPCFIYNKELDLLEWVIEDTLTVASSVGPAHAADVLYNADRSRIVGVQIWGAMAAIKRAIAEDDG